MGPDHPNGLRTAESTSWTLALAGGRELGLASGQHIRVRCPADGRLDGREDEGNMRPRVHTNGDRTSLAEAHARRRGQRHGRELHSPCQSDSCAVAPQKLRAPFQRHEAYGSWLRGRSPKVTRGSRSLSPRGSVSRVATVSGSLTVGTWFAGLGRGPEAPRSTWWLPLTG